MTVRFPLAAAAAALLLAASAVAQQAPPRGDSLTLADVVSLALENNPDTRAAHAQARAAGYAHASARGARLPTVAADVPVARNRSLGGEERTTLTPGVSLSYLLLDFGGRGGAIAQARETAAAAAADRDASVQATVLRAQSAYFAYNAARDLREAGRATVRSAAEARDAAVGRYGVGLATVADTLQAATALAQARLAQLEADGEVEAARGGLAAAMGTTADAPFEVSSAAGTDAVGTVAERVDALMERAVRDRPELAAARADSAGAEAAVRRARGAGLPALTVGGAAGRTLSPTDAANGNTYGIAVGVDVPLFSGFSRRNDVRAARARAEVAAALLLRTRVEVANDVYASYSALRVAAGRVDASAQLLASALVSEEVARGRYAEGVGSLLDLLTAQSALANARARAAEARWRWQDALARLAFDVGTLDASGAPGLPLTPAATAVPTEVSR
jgi:outer membrane protein TolC